jgi:phenylacetate-CoA ligase
MWLIARHHFDNNPFYREKVGKHFPDKWECLPIMCKSDYQNDLEKLLSKGYSRKNTYVSNTSGSSGHPFYFAKNKEAHAFDWALIRDRYSWHGLSITPRQARFYGIPLEKWAYRKEKFKDLIMNRVRFSVFDLSDKKLEEYLTVFRKQRFVCIYGYTNSLVLFSQFLLRNNTVLKDECPTLKCCIATSELLTSEDRKSLSKAFGLSVINEYGASEVGLIAFESLEEEWLLSEETLFHEVVNDDGLRTEGKEGNIVVTDLDNKAMPFIRYNIGDLGVISDNNVSDCKYRKLDQLIGRANDTIVLPSGKVSPGLTFYYISRSILESSGILNEFIIRQTSIDSFIIDIMSDRELREDEVSVIKEKMDIYLEPGLTLKINRVQKIKRPPSGKIKHFYSEISL